MYAESGVFRSDFDVNDGVVEGARMRLVESWSCSGRTTNLEYTLLSLKSFGRTNSIGSSLSFVVVSASMKTPSWLEVPGDALVALDVLELSSPMINPKIRRMMAVQRVGNG